MNFIKESFGKPCHFSVISNNEFANLINIKYKNFFNEILDQEISHLIIYPQIKYMMLYFIHHGQGDYCHKFKLQANM